MLKERTIMPQLILLFLLILIVYLLVLLDKTFNRSKKKNIMRSKDMRGVDYSIFKQDVDWLEQIDKNELIIQSQDGLNLHACLIPNKKKSLCVILCHGYSATRNSMAVFAKHYFDTYGAQVLIVDARAHGLSDGNVIGFGYHDRNDLQLWIKTVKHELGENINIVLHGVSMGASTLLYASIDGYDSNVKGMVCDSAFIDLKPIFIRQMKMIYNLPAFPFIYFVELYMKYWIKIPFEETNILKQKDKLLTPCLIVHGTSDRFVPYDMAVKLNEIYPVYHMFLSIENAKHALSYSNNPDRYKEAIHEFLNNILS